MVTVVLEGHLTRAALDAQLAAVDANTAVVVDCRSMTGYDLDARHAFTEWNSRHSAKVAVVTPKPAWHMIVSTMALATGRPLRAFDDDVSALAWLNES